MAQPLPWWLIIFLFWLSSSTAASSASLSQEGANLLAIMKALQLNLRSWVGDDPCQNWEGVLCDSSHRVAYLNLSNKGAQGSIPSEISTLQHLVTLDLSNGRNVAPPLNQITGGLSYLAGLASLQSLNLSLNNIHLDTFPAVVLSLTNLVALRLDNNNISGPLPKELAQLKNLQYLYLGNNSFTGPLPDELSELTNLLELSLWENNFNSKIPPQYGNLVNLTYLNLHDCNLYGGLPLEFGGLKNIRRITLYKNQLTGAIPDGWNNMENLKDLFLHYNSLTKHFPSWVEQLPNIYNISLDYNFFYGSLSSLENLKVPYTSVTCNFFSGSLPTLQPNITFNSSGNCFTTSDSNSKIKCSQEPYFNCMAFLQDVPDGSCPDCPPLQVIEDATTCVCTLPDGSSSRYITRLVSALVGTVGFLTIVAGLIWAWWRRSKKTGTSSNYESLDYWEGPDGVQRFSLQDLLKATNNFSSSHEIGVGGFGKVFCGVLNGKKVAIKRAHLSSIQSTIGFRNEVLLLSRLHHRNLVHLLGFCEDDGIQVLVYEYLPNGNLHELLFKNQGKTTLDWLKRLDIAVGVAQGLEYIHSFADPPVIHRDIKPSNILLDDSWVAKLADFGISRAAPEFETSFCTRPAGTVGYIDPQYILREHLTTASDVYSFGMVLLELISGKRCIDSSRLEDHNLAEWVKVKMRIDGLTSVVDPQLGDGYPKQVYYDIVRLAIDCASFQSEDRPSMKAVLTILDACRWAVSAQLLPMTIDTPSVPQNSQDPQREEELSSSQSSGSSERMLTKDKESSLVGVSTVFSLSSLTSR